VRVVTDFPHAVREIEHRWIPMPDGCRLAARLWLPADADAAPVPAVLEYLPYRKRDFTRVRDEPIHRYFAGHGHAAVRVDVRGTGDSEGVLTDEYSEQELADGEAVLAWIAAQPWCTGAVGMIGKSWGGFNALQLAARRPPALRAVISVCASDDRHADDAHYMGGCLLNENLTWGAVLQAFAALPPDPAVVGERWRAMWAERLDAAVPFVETWLRHQRRDDYWRRGSVRDDLGAIGCPVYAVGGWADGYTNAIPRLLAGLAVPRKGLVGPWGHVYPHRGVPGPSIGFLQEAVRWWDRWLRNAGGTVSEPLYRVWLGGGWVAEASWPSPRIVTRTWTLDRGRLRAGPVPERRLRIASPQSTGAAAGEWCAFGADDLPGDQHADDAGSLTFDTPPLATPLALLGAPVASLVLAVDRPRALVAVRLNEVGADGASSRVTYGVLNLAPGDGEPLDPRRRYAVRVVMNDAAHVFAAGSRIRVAVSTAYWPLVWPSPAPVRLSVFTGASRLELPVRPANPQDAALAPFAPSEGAALPAYRELRPPRHERTTTRDGGGVTRTTITSEGGAFRAGGAGRLEAIDLELAERTVRRYEIRDDDPLSARAAVEQELTLRRGAWAVRVETATALRATADRFELDVRLDAREGEQTVVSRRWHASIPGTAPEPPRRPSVPAVPVTPGEVRAAHARGVC
jgi:uncharacterized protein